jgi:GNAT superfamily N-acetyltransferase
VTAAVERAAAVAARFHARWLTMLGEQRGNPCGVEVRWFADDLVATIAVAEPELRWVQHVAGFRSRHLPLARQILDWYAAREVPCRFEACDDEAAAALADLGGVDAGPIDLLVGAPKAPVVDPSVAIEQVDTAGADDFAALLLAGHDVDDAAAPHLAALAGFVTAPDIRCWIGFLDGAAAGAAAFVVDDGVGLLANASTTPAGRGRGVQSALIATRIAAAVEAGCDLVASAAIPNKPSHRNLMRAGLEPVEHRRILHVG